VISNTREYQIILIIKYSIVSGARLMPIFPYDVKCSQGETDI